MQPSDLAAGTRLAGRYRLQEPLGGQLGVASWSAVDELLRRTVGIETLSTDDPRSEAFSTAALAAARVTDPRFLHVLDVSDEDGVLYVVREWAAATDLAQLVAAEPLSPADAAHVAREVADALTAAHRAGLAHLHLRPTRVLRSDGGQVKVAGLAVEAALRGTTVGDDAAEVDARGCGAVLYAALTGYWPDADSPLPAAPPENGHLRRPRHVRAGIPSAIDDICMQALGTATESGPALRTPEEVAIRLRTGPVSHRLEARRREAVDAQVTTTSVAPALLAGPGLLPPPAPPNLTGRPGPGPAMRVLRMLIAGVVVVALALVVWQVALALSDENASSGGSDSPPTPSVSALPISAVADFDPEGEDRTENRELVHDAVDGNPNTAWITASYYRRADLGGLKSGVGLVVDLGSVRDVSAVEVDLGGNGTDVELRVAPEDASSPPPTADGYRKVAAKAGAGSRAELRPTSPVRTRFVVVWLTSLPRDGSAYRGSVSEVRVLG